MKQKITLNSGSILELDYASWNIVKQLKNNILTIFKNNIKDFDVANEFSKIMELVEKKEDWMLVVLNKFLGSLLDCYTDNQLEDIFYELAKICLLNGERITPDTFEDIDNRIDYIPCFFHIIKFNLEPFFTKANMK